MNRQSIIVAGGVNQDILCFSNDELLYTSNPGRVVRTFGGVGLNLARHLAQLGYRVSLLSAVGNDAAGTSALHHAQSHNIDISLLQQKSGYATATYVAINTPQGDMLVAVADMAVIDSLAVNDIKSKITACKDAEALVLDANLSPELVGYLLDFAQSANIKQKIGVGVSVKKINNFRHRLADFDLLIVNQMEADALLMPAERHLPMEEKIAIIIQMGVKQCLVTMAAAGALFVEHGSLEFFSVPNLIEVIDSHGAGDAFAAGFIAHRLGGDDTKRSMAFAFMLAERVLKVRGAEFIAPYL